MTNIPTELLRTFVAVVDLRSFTRAAHSLGITQPAVSAQIKRLQQILGGELMDKRAPGVALTAFGENVLAHARRLLAINDRILSVAGTAAAAAQTLRVGVPGNFVGDPLWRTFAWSRAMRPDIRFHVRSTSSELLLRDLQQSELDVALTVSNAGPHAEALFHWTEELVWVRAPLTRVEPDLPVPLVSAGENCLTHRQVIDALERAGREYTLPFADTRLGGLAAAAGAGLGVMALPRCMSRAAGLVVWADAPLPRLPPIVCNVCIRDGADEMAAEFARAFAEALMGGPAPDLKRAERAAS
ncbi:MAG TPA: LysR family transcriptional regulator [Xanthobacteraceae bacterium]|nr:LysR family transcriptional regulator [Xanthobacteraceae bacterium]